MTMPVTEAEKAFASEIRALATRAEELTLSETDSRPDRAALTQLARETLAAARRFQGAMRESVPSAKTAISEAAPARRISDVDARAMAAQVLAHARAEQERQATEASHAAVRADAARIVREATERPLHERTESERRRIETDLWTLVEAVKPTRERAPFWRDLPES